MGVKLKSFYSSAVRRRKYFVQSTIFLKIHQISHPTIQLIWSFSFHLLILMSIEEAPNVDVQVIQMYTIPGLEWFVRRSSPLYLAVSWLSPADQICRTA